MVKLKLNQYLPINEVLAWFFLFSVWKSAFSTCVQALRCRHHLRGDGNVHKPAARAAVRVGPPEEA